MPQVDSLTARLAKRTSRPPGIVVAVAFFAAVFVSGYGIVSNHLLRTLWLSSSLKQLGVLAAVFALWSGTLIAIAPEWFVPATVAASAVAVIAGVGPLPLFAVLFLLFSCYSIGALLLPEREAGGGLHFFRVLLGVSVWMAVFGLMAHFPVNFASVYFALLLIPVCVKPKLTLAYLNHCANLVRPSRQVSRGDCWAVALVAFAIVCNLLLALIPETGADALGVHLMVPAWISFQHIWPFDFHYLSWAVMPLGAEWCYTAVYLLGGEFAARLLNFAFLAMIAALIYNASSRYVSRPTSLLLAGLFVSSPLAQVLTASLFVENVWAAFLLGAVLALDQFHQSGEGRWLYLNGAFIGSALSVKLGTIAFLIPVAMVVCWELIRRRNMAMNRIRLAAVWTCELMFLGAVPYAFAYWATGNPLFPFMNHIFKSPWFDSLTPLVDSRWSLPLDFSVPSNLLFHTHLYLEGPDGSFGFQYLLLLALGLALFQRGSPYLGWLALSLSIAFGVLTFETIAYARYLYPALPLITIAAAVALRQLHSSPRLLLSIRAALILAFLLNICFPSPISYQPKFALRSFDKQKMQMAILKSSPVREIVAYLNQAHPSEPVALFESNSVAGLRARAYAFSWQNGPYMHRALAAQRPADYGRLAQSLGLKYFIAPLSWRNGKRSEAAIPGFLGRYTESEYIASPFELRHLKPDAAVQWSRERPSAVLAPCGPGLIDDRERRVQYSGRWSKFDQVEACGGTLSFSDTEGAEVTLPFSGTSVTYVFTKAFNRGKALVLIDGKFRGKVDLFSYGVEWRSRITFNGLTPGPHVIDIRVARERDADSEGFFVDLDGFLVS